MVKVFVYGSLRMGEGNHHYLGKATCVAEQCWTNGSLFDTGYGYPAMKREYSSRTYGELYTVSERELARLDQLEGYMAGGKNNLYERIQQTVHTDNGSIIAYVYVANQKNLLNKKIINGDWKEYRIQLNQMNSVLYFAYGSCMDQNRFMEKKVDHYFQKILGVGVLSNYSLRFNRKSTEDGMGRADIVEVGGRVEGKLYEIPVKALDEYLYTREGAPKVYRPTFITVDWNGKKVQALTFVVVNKQSETVPPDWYEEEILRGADGFLSTEYISQLKSHIRCLKKTNTGGM